MKRSSGRDQIRGRKCANAPPNLNPDPSDQEYRVGPGRPPREHQFKPGQSGNPKGARRKPRSIADLKAVFERALSGKVTLRQGEQEKIITKAAAGIEQLVNQFAKGDRHARGGDSRAPGGFASKPPRLYALRQHRQHSQRGLVPVVAGLRKYPVRATSASYRRC
jgi:hypothetical protein